MSLPHSPYHALLLLSDEKSLLGELPIDCSPALVRVIKTTSAVKNLQQLAQDADLALLQVPWGLEETPWVGRMGSREGLDASQLAPQVASLGPPSSRGLLRGLLWWWVDLESDLGSGLRIDFLLCGGEGAVKLWQRSEAIVVPGDRAAQDQSQGWGLAGLKQGYAGCLSPRGSHAEPAPNPVALIPHATPHGHTGLCFCARCHLLADPRAHELPFLIRWGPLLPGCGSGLNLGGGWGQGKAQGEVEGQGQGTFQATA